ncbi:hypothetical protein B0T22DRAFT_476208 [Podospora appendiculata]|uniref:DUF6604 domain-containing protein n=1 Tax=Podospora appendiculata TaxID=314037 RepID=A0AAE0XH45_9PEZI|nr:hypothetical protein B0T22DRAFT_476208 [Podospora appendiculata]
MLPSALTSTYQLYKQDTDVVASWLAHTAKSLGCPHTLLNAGSNANPQSQAATPQPQDNRPKGKNRKQAKKAGQSGPGSAPSPAEKPKYTLPIQSFVPLAEFIGQMCDPIIPAFFTDAINRAIEIRKGFGDMVVDSVADPSITSTVAGNSILVDVLEKATKPDLNLASLKGALPVADSVKGEPLSGPNPFDLLEVYQVSEANATESLESLPQSAANHRQIDIDIDYEAEKTDSRLSSFVAFAALFKDLNTLRTRARELWTAYDAGEFS